MPRRPRAFLRLLALAGALALLGPVGWSQARRPVGSIRVYDAVLFVLDDVAMADLALYGGPVETPNLKALASRGVTFSNAYSNPVCEPTRRSIQYGHWWLRGNGRDCTSAVSPDTPPLARPSIAEGLPGHVSAFYGKWHLGSAPGGGPWECAPIVRGYEFWLAGVPSNVVGDLFCMGSVGYREWLRVEASTVTCLSAVSDQYHPRILLNSFLESWPALGSPRFACVNSNLAHAPFHRPPADMLPPGYPPTNTNREKFEAMIRALDSNLGEILKVVDLSQTVVIVVGDNGTPSNVAPDPLRAKNTTFERGVRVPLVIAGGPTVRGGRRSSELVHVADLWSTIVDVGGGDPTHDVSRSLRPVLEKRAHARLHEYVLCGTQWETPSGDRCAISADGFKLRQLDTDGDEVPDVEELYDLASDPLESTDLAARLPAVVAAMRAWIEAEAP